MTISDGTNTLYIYGTYDADGTRYGSMETQPAVGDTITLYGMIGQYNGTAQMKNVTIVTFTSSESAVEESTEAAVEESTEAAVEESTEAAVEEATEPAVEEPTEAATETDYSDLEESADEILDSEF